MKRKMNKTAICQNNIHRAASASDFVYTFKIGIMQKERGKFEGVVSFCKLKNYRMKVGWGRMTEFRAFLVKIFFRNFPVFFSNFKTFSNLPFS